MAPGGREAQRMSCLAGTRVKIPLSNSQEGEEDNSLDAEELGKRGHGVQLSPHGLVEEDKTVHGHKL